MMKVNLLETHWEEVKELEELERRMTSCLRRRRRREGEERGRVRSELG